MVVETVKSCLKTNEVKRELLYTIRLHNTKKLCFVYFTNLN